MNAEAPKSFKEIKQKGHENLGKAKQETSNRFAKLRARIGGYLSRKGKQTGEVLRGGKEVIKKGIEMGHDAIALATEPRQVVELLDQRREAWRVSKQRAIAEASRARTEERKEMVSAVRAEITDVKEQIVASAEKVLMEVDRFLERKKLQSKSKAVQSKLDTLTATLKEIDAREGVLDEEFAEMLRMMANRKRNLEAHREQVQGENSQAESQMEQLNSFVSRMEGKTAFQEAVEEMAHQPEPAEENAPPLVAVNG